MHFLQRGFRLWSGWVVLGVLWLAWVAGAKAQNIPITSYHPDKVINQTFIDRAGKGRPKVSPVFDEVWQGPDGFVYLHSPYGVFVFDGHHWDYFYLEDEDIVRAVAHNDVGQVWLGGEGVFGQLEISPKGRYQFVDAVEQDNDFPEAIIATVQDAFSPGKDSVAFITPNMMFWKYGETWKTLTPNTSFGRFHVLGQDSLMVQQWGVGLYYFNGDRLVLYDNQEIFRDRNISFTLPHPEGGWIIGKGNRLYRYQNKVLTPIYSSFTDQLLAGEFTTAVWLDNDALALGTAAQGIFFLNPEGALIMHVDRGMGLVDNGVTGLIVGEDDQLWCTTFNGISRIDYTFPFSAVYLDNTPNGAVYSFGEHLGEVYIGSKNGLYKYNEEAVVQVPGAPGAIHSLLSFEDELLFGGDFGLFRLKNGEVRLLSSVNTRKLLSISQDRIVLAGTGGVMQLEKQGSNWVFTDTVGGLTDGEYYFAEEWEGELYVSSVQEELFKITPATLRDYSDASVLRMDTADGVNGNIRIWIDKDSLTFGGTYGMFRLNENRDALLPDGRFGEGFTNGVNDVFRLLRQENAYWFVSLQRLYRAIPEDDGFTIDSSLYQYFSGITTYALFEDSRNRVWIGGTDGISLYNPQFEVEKVGRPQAEIRRVIVDDSTIYFGEHNIPLYDPERGIEAELLPSQNELTFYFSSPTYRDLESIQFWYRLQGWEQDYTQYFGNQNKVTYKNLSFGTYTFQVVAVDKQGQASVPAEYVFVIQPPWYFQWWAFIFYGILLLGFILLMVLLNTRRLRNAKATLEALVRVRTQELDLQKRQVEDQKAEIERKNHKIEENMRVLEQKNKQIQNYNAELLDSLRYAKRLQDSIFASTEDLQRHFPDSFLFSQPKEIVGGDFCWVSKVGQKTVLVLADCTGHGVPGAFMSIVGYNHLQRILMEERLDAPGEILTKLDLVLQQAVSHAESTAMKDGMDLSIGVYDPEKKVLTFSGAFQSIYLLRERSLREVKGNRFTAGVYFGASEKHFEEHQLAIEPDDIVYFLSDGIQDQFGGSYNNKLMKKGLRKLLMEIHEEPFERQHDILASRVHQWMGSHEQIDDMMAIGIRF